MYERAGLGEGGVPVLQPVLGTGLSVAGTFTTAALAPGALTGASLAVPVIGAAIAGVTLAVGLWMNRMGPKQKVYTTRIVDEAEPLLVQNLDAWRRSPKHRSEQAAALQNFDAVWAAVVASCDRPEMGAPGQNCIRDRQRGSTKGYDWFALYRDPIANDPNVTADPVDAFLSGEWSGGQSVLPLLLIGGLALWAVAS